MLSLYSLVEHASPYNIFTGDRQLLARLSGQIEREILDKRIQSQVFAGFQQLSYFAPVSERYQRIADQCKAVWVFGVPDAMYALHHHMHTIELNPGHPLEREWFVVVNDRQYKRALIAEEITPRGTPHADRVFDGLLTTDPVVVDLMYQHLLAVVETIAK